VRDRGERSEKMLVLVKRILMAACLGGIGLSVACAPPEVTEVKSPDGALVVKLIDDRGGGAATSTYQRVVIEAPHKPFGPKAVVFEGENMSGRRFGDLNLSWSDGRTLNLGYCDGTIERFAKSAHIGDRAVAVRLIQEPIGDWPASTPIGQRGGPPPCA
jgi:hypothetical protein